MTDRAGPVPSPVTDSVPRGSQFLFVLGTVLLGMILVFIVRPLTVQAPLITWVGLLLTAALVTLPFQIRENASWSLFTHIVIGLLWVATAYSLSAISGSDIQIILTVILSGAALLAAINLHARFFTALAAIGFGLPLFALSLFIQQRDLAELLSPLCVLAWLCTIGLTWFLHQAFLSRRAMQDEKRLLLANIEDKMVELDTLRASESEARRDAEEANQAKSRFMAHSSHDLRQPLHAMGLLLETLPEKGLDKRAQAVIDRVRQSLHGLSGLFDSLLDVTLLDTGQVEVKPRTFRIDEVLSQIVQDFDEMARSESVELIHIQTGLYVHTDPIILHRMVQNLVSNAIKHADSGRVLIGTRRQGDMISVTVIDTGRGIDDADQARIFEEFTKLENQSVTTGSGLGLGLSIVKRLADIIGVNISLRSQSGSGSLFSIDNLIRVRSPEKSETAPGHKQYNEPSKHANIVIIDDDEDVLRATKQLVEKWGFSAETFTGFDPDNSVNPGVLLCDYQLADDQNGIAVIQAFKDRYGADFPAVLITANTSVDISDRAKAMGLPVLYKPVKPVQLRSLLLTTLADQSP